MCMCILPVYIYISQCIITVVKDGTIHPPFSFPLSRSISLSPSPPTRFSLFLSSSFSLDLSPSLSLNHSLTHYYLPNVMYPTLFPVRASVL